MPLSESSNNAVKAIQELNDLSAGLRFSGSTPAREQRQASGMIQMPVREQHCIESAVRCRWRTIKRLGFLAALKKTAIDENSRPFCLEDVTRAGDFASGSANERDLHRAIACSALRSA